MTSTTGLTSTQVLEQRRRDGPNRLPSAPRRTLWLIVWAALTQPMFLLLLVTGALYALLGSITDAAVLLVSVLAVGGLTVFQEYRTERVLHTLKSLSSPRCTVVRDGVSRRIASEELVCGDRLIVNEGDRLAADARLLEGDTLQVDESLLTGESAPVTRHAGEGSVAQLRAGSLVVQGDAVAVVTATGAATALGRIGQSLVQLHPRASRLQVELRQLVQRVAVVALLVCVLAAALYTLRDGSWTSGLLVGLTLAMSLVPEEFAVVWSVMLALGAWRLAQSQVLTRQAQAIEALGTVTVLCVDKTGTLTHNRMALAALYDGTDEAAQAGTAGLRTLLCGAARASVRHGIEPMDRAIFDALGPDDDGGCQAGPRQGVRAGRPYVIRWWLEAAGAQVVVKGAPEAVLALCTGPLCEPLRQRAAQWSRRGLRVLAVAQAYAAQAPAGGELPGGLALQALGLLAFADPLRAEVPQAIAECRGAGVRVVMVTGDAPETARAIAAQAGLDPGRVMTGAQLQQLSDLHLRQAAREVDVFARVEPAQKLRIVQALQAGGDVVAMTGDGVNDAPALRAADIGVAMGQRGTDVAREAAALVLLDDHFASLVEAVRAGRRVFVNLRKAMGYLFAVHVPIVGVSLAPVLLGGPVLLLPVHVVLLELIIDPACSLVFEAEAPPADLMRVPPRRSDTRLFALDAVVRALTVGGSALLGVIAVQVLCRQAGASPDDLRLASLGSIVAANLLMLVGFRGGRVDNRVFDALLLGVSLVWVALLGVPGAGSVFGFGSQPHGLWAAAAAVPGAWAALRLLHRERVRP